MASRGSALSRAIKFFEEADLREARAAFTIVTDVMNERVAKAKAALASQVKAAGTPRKTRKKRGEQAVGASASGQGSAADPGGTAAASA